VVIGRVVAAFGVQGWVRVKAFTQKPATLGDFDGWWLKGPTGSRECALESFEMHSKGPVAKLAGIDDRDAADRLRGTEIAVPRTALAEPEEGSHYWVDLVGLEVVDEDGRLLGAIESLFEAGDTSVLVVRGERERMIPFVAEYVKGVDREAGRVTVDWKADYDA
jgi:16S rRNA processing protein RimM